MIEIISLHQSYAMLTCDSAFHLYGSNHHPMDNFLGLFALSVVVQQDSYQF